MFLVKQKARLILKIYIMEKFDLNSYYNKAKNP